MELFDLAIFCSCLFALHSRANLWAPFLSGLSDLNDHSATNSLGHTCIYGRFTLDVCTRGKREGCYPKSDWRKEACVISEWKGGGVKNSTNLADVIWTCIASFISLSPHYELVRFRRPNEFKTWFAPDVSGIFFCVRQKKRDNVQPKRLGYKRCSRCVIAKVISEFDCPTSFVSFP